MSSRFAVAVVVVALAPACTLGEPTAPPATVPAPAPVPEPDAAPATLPAAPASESVPPATPAPLGGAPAVFVTHHRLDGNRYAVGRGGLPGVTPVDIRLGGPPEWVVGALVAGEAVWVVALEDGTLEAWATRANRPLRVALDLPPLPAGTPPAVLVTERGEVGVLAPEASESPLTHPIVLPTGRRAAVSAAGSLNFTDPDGAAGEVTASLLPDARIAGDEEGRIMALAGATDRYAHGVLGDALEASGVVVVEPDGRARRFEVPEGEVVEGIAPIWADLGGPAGREIVVTLSGPGAGARVVAYSPSGELLASGPPIGRGNRWRHQIAVAPFGTGGETELAVVRTPHIGGVVEFYRWEGEELRIVAGVPGFTSHGILSRNLDLALAADADGDGRVEVVLPTQDRTSLGGVARTAAGAEVAWTVPLDGSLATNLAAVELPGGGLELAAGRDDRVLRVWPAPNR